LILYANTYKIHIRPHGPLPQHVYKEGGSTYQKLILYPQEYLVLIQIVETIPADGQATESDQDIPQASEMPGKCIQQTPRYIPEADEMVPQVYGDRIHSDDLEIKPPFIVLPYINYQVERSEEQQADASCMKIKSAGPDPLNHRIGAP